LFKQTEIVTHSRTDWTLQQCYTRLQWLLYRTWKWGRTISIL